MKRRHRLRKRGDAKRRKRGQCRRERRSSPRWQKEAAEQSRRVSTKPRRWRRAGRTLLDCWTHGTWTGGRGRSRAAADSAWSRCGLRGLWSLWLLLRGG
ncbi:hypothetical protein M440DRAFT_1186227 [Trichoderma longibrachiatum ATCC 18648]|uniref:Uncharacterized protein n=1 Tax=Trichoderma longibrachiatum ATCC 18648 TaxID=983965 RepID=A0A2T4C9F8_TRILO|nr:hypothetical protein M440DRAFT_1186227 [Trichoderma longibrachiatum ATCC 18648]